MNLSFSSCGIDIAQTPPACSQWLGSEAIGLGLEEGGSFSISSLKNIRLSARAAENELGERNMHGGAKTGTVEEDC